MPVLADRPDAKERVRLAALSLKAKKERASRAFDPLLGDSFEQATARREACREDLGEYGMFTRGHVPARHHRLWIDAITAVTERRVPQHKLLILSPPGMAKSTWLSEIFPTWHLGRHPDHNLAFITSAEDMAFRFGGTIRQTLQFSEAHKAVFPEPAMIPAPSRGWSNAGLYLRGTRPGKDPGYFAAGFNTTIMGARLDGIIIDDPQNQRQAQSEVEQESAKDYYETTLLHRLRPETGWLVVISTRWHEVDLVGHLLAEAASTDDWIVIATPMTAPEIVPGVPPDPLGRKPGELLWPEYYTAEQLKRQRETMDAARYNLVFEINPTGLGGDVFRDASWFRPLPSDFFEPKDDDKSLRDRLTVIQAWDLAFSEKDTACYTACVTIGLDHGNNIYILRAYRERLTTQGVRRMVMQMKQQYRADRVVVEESAFRHQVTRALVHEIKRDGLINIGTLHPTVDKVARAMLPANRAESGMVFVDKGASWWPAFLAEMLGFPKTAYKDQVDAFALAVHEAEHLAQRPKPFYARVNPDGRRHANYALPQSIGIRS